MYVCMYVYCVTKLITAVDEVSIRHYFPAICMYVFVCICMYLYVFVCICMYLYVSVCMYVYVYMYVCMYIVLLSS